ncbi:hypothetical protein F0562_006818 [Nyssa sinensis]|uniref:CRAL-TRIO domain-containing protein n=1 Tax=Nyssa sinensis TaxID=561372 RepID=A0A5J5AN04_9ASTE|nr:hypothetical protein F0562_006818 [Nyssa sinensis]
MSSLLSQSDQENLIEKLQIFEIQGRDKRGRILLRIIGKFFPARIVSFDVLKKHLEEKIFPRLENGPFSVLYVHTDVQRTKNFPGISALRSIYESIPINVRQNLEAVYFVHPGLQARLFLATFGRLMFSGGFYEKLRYINNLNFLWDHVRRNEIEIPDFVSDHDEDLEYRPIIDHGLESDYPRVYGAPAVDSPAPMYSMRFHFPELFQGLLRYLREMVFLCWARPSPQEQKECINKSGAFNYDSKYRGATAKTVTSLQENGDLSKDGFLFNHAHVLVGSGLETYEKGKIALQSWRHFGLNWSFVDPKTPIQSGVKFCVCVKEFVPWLMMPLQVVYVNENRNAKSAVASFGFGSGTLQGHLLAGEERFSIALDENNQVCFIYRR